MGEEVTQSSPPKVDPPLGMYSARVDDKGRLKLPVDFQEYFGALQHRKFFITSTDRLIARIYVTSEWRSSEKFLTKYVVDAAAAQAMRFNAADLGGGADLDGQGRLLLPAELRKALGMENQTVRLYLKGDHLEVLSDQIYEQQRAQHARISAERLMLVDTAMDAAKEEAAEAAGR